MQSKLLWTFVLFEKNYVFFWTSAQEGPRVSSKSSELDKFSGKKITRLFLHRYVALDVTLTHCEIQLDDLELLIWGYLQRMLPQAVWLFKLGMLLLFLTRNPWSDKEGKLLGSHSSRTRTGQVHHSLPCRRRQPGKTWPWGQGFSGAALCWAMQEDLRLGAAVRESGQAGEARKMEMVGQDVTLAKGRWTEKTTVWNDICVHTNE